MQEKFIIKYLELFLWLGCFCHCWFENVPVFSKLKSHNIYFIIKIASLQVVHDFTNTIEPGILVLNHCSHTLSHHMARPGFMSIYILSWSVLWCGHKSESNLSNMHFLPENSKKWRKLKSCNCGILQPVINASQFPSTWNVIM